MIADHELTQARAQHAALGQLVATLDPGDTVLRDAAPLWDEFDAIERLGAVAKTLLACRVAESQVWKTEGHRSAADYLALRAGTSVGAARRALEASKRLQDLPATAAASRSGSLSSAQIDLITDAASRDPEFEDRLLDLAGRASLAELREECGRVKASADPDPEGTRQRIHEGRRLRQHTDTDGAWNLYGRGTVDAGASVNVVLNSVIDELFQQARTDGRTVTREQLAFDALVRITDDYWDILHGIDPWDTNDDDDEPDNDTDSEIPNRHTEQFDDTDSEIPNSDTEASRGDTDPDGTDNADRDENAREPSRHHSGHETDTGPETDAAFDSGLDPESDHTGDSDSATGPGSGHVGDSDTTGPRDTDRTRGADRGPVRAGNTDADSDHNPEVDAASGRDPGPAGVDDPAASTTTPDPTTAGSASDLAQPNTKGLVGSADPTATRDPDHPPAGHGPPGDVPVDGEVLDLFAHRHDGDELNRKQRRQHDKTHRHPRRRRRKPKPAKTNPKTLGLLRVDLQTLRRGTVEGDETCEIAGVGPVSVDAARALLGDAILAMIITNGRDVVNVTHLGRRPTWHQELALLWSQPICSVQGCNCRRVEWDHRTPWANRNQTRVDNLDGLCRFHHQLKTLYGWALVEGTGRRPMVPPDDPRHPNNQPGSRQVA